MRDKKSIRIKNSIATRLLRTVFGIYLLIAMGVTLTHMITEYNYTKNNIINELSALHKTFEPGLVISIWNLDIDQLQSTLNGLVNIPVIVGMKVEDELGEKLAGIGIIVKENGDIVTCGSDGSQVSSTRAKKLFSKLLWRKFPIIDHVEKEKIGYVTIYSDSSVVFQKVKLGFAFLVINSIIKTAALWMIFLWFAKKLLGRPLSILTESTEKLDLNNLEQIKIDVKTKGRNELKILEEAFNAMIQNMIKDKKKMQDLAAENARMGAELDISRQLQMMALPSVEELNRVEGLDIAAFMDPADEVGGDYYDVLQYNGNIKVSIGDVTGHGLESGVLMLMTQSSVRTLLNSGETNPTRFLSILNRTIYDNVQRMQIDKNLTLSMLDYHKGHLKLSGQHEEMILVREGGKIELIDTIDLGFPIGIEDNIAHFINEATVSLQPGDGIVLYTDGITEAVNIADEQFGLERLCQVISRNWNESADEIKNRIIIEVMQFIGEQKVYDDLALVIMKQK